MTTRAEPHELAHRIAVGGLAGMFAYQGLVPKLWKVASGDVRLWRSVGFEEDAARRMVRITGAVEATFALVMLGASRRRWPFAIALATMPVLLAGTTRGDRSALTRAFNPGSTAIAISALACVALATHEPRGRS